MSDSPRQETSAPRFSPWTWSHEIGPDPGARRRHVLRLVLLVGLIVLLTVWFQLHVQPFVTEVFFIGGTLTLWGILNLIRSSWAEWGEGGKAQPAVRRWLGNPLAGELLTLGLILTVLLFAGTSSIYCSFEEPRPGEDKYEVEILEEGRPFVEKAMEVTSSRRLDGRPFFLRWRPVRLTFRIKEQPGLKPLPKSFWPGQPLRVEVPSEFKRRRLRLLRLVPGKGLFGDELARPGAASSGHSLQVEADGQVLRIPDFRFQTLYLGASEEDLGWAIGDEEKALFRHELEDYLRKIPMPEADWASYLADWEGTPLPRPDARLPKSGKIVVILGQGGREVCRQEVILKDEDGIQTKFLEIPQV